jgi:hypothetical protein
METKHPRHAERTKRPVPEYEDVAKGKARQVEMKPKLVSKKVMPSSARHVITRCIEKEWTHLVPVEAEGQLTQGHVSLGPDKGLQTLLLDRDIAMLEHTRDVGGGQVTGGLDGSEFPVL